MTAAALRSVMPADHPLRFDLNDEVHARPPEQLSVPTQATFLALFTDAAERDREWDHVCRLVRSHEVEPPPKGVTHLSLDLGAFRLKWERHTEFSRYKFIRTAQAEDPFAEPAIRAVPKEWLGEVPGRVMVAAHVALVSPEADVPDYDGISTRLFAGHTLIGSAIAGGAATALTDLRIHDDGFSRVLVHNRSMTPRQAGRMVQRILEIDTYRVMALLALPIARELGPKLTRYERELAEITSRLVQATKVDEAKLLERLTRLEAEIENAEAAHHYRFTAASAYHELVQRRIAELREERIQGLQTFQEFTDRRLAPAMSTCASVAQRQESLSRRVARATQLLSTRVDVTREGQNQALLESMNRRAQLQLRLQETVEGLSVAAVTYYIVGLVGYAAKGLKALGAPLHVEVTTGASIPVVALLVALGVRRIRRAVSAAPEPQMGG